MGTLEIEDYFGSKVPECYGKRDPILNPPVHPKCYIDHRGLGATFLDKMKQHRNNIAQIEIDSGIMQTYDELMLRTIRVAQEMQARGFEAGDLVSLCTLNHLDACVPLLASLFLGVRVASLDPSLSLNDSQYLLKMVQPKMVFCGTESENLIETALLSANIESEIVVFGETDRHTPFSDFVNETGTEEEFEAREVNDIFETAIIFFSSGTTGLPKGICLGHYGILMQNQYFTMDRDVSVILYFTSLYWVSGLMMVTMSILVGGCRVLCRSFNETLMMKAVQDYKVKFTFISPILSFRITQNPACCDYDTSSLSLMLVGGGPISAEQINRLRHLLPHTRVCNAFGMTEVSGCAALFHPEREFDLILSKPMSCGRPIPGFSYKIVDPDTEQTLGPNKRGELRIKTKCVMNGYYNKPVEESQSAWDNEGYLHTGDIAYYDEDYCFYVVDRLKDLLKYQSWHVPPAEIEQVILEHPAVKSAVVIGLPDEVDGDLPLGAVVLKPGVEVTENEIVEFVNERVSNLKKLRGGVVFVDSIPLTPSGKPRRRDLRDTILNKNIP